MRGQVSAGNSITGAFTRCDIPSEVPVGEEIKIVVDGNLNDPTRSPTAVWHGIFTAEGDGRRDFIPFTGTGKTIGPDYVWPHPPPTLSLGIMPNYPINVTVKLLGNPSVFAEWEW